MSICGVQKIIQILKNAKGLSGIIIVIEGVVVTTSGATGLGFDSRTGKMLTFFSFFFAT